MKSSIAIVGLLLLLNATASLAQSLGQLAQDEAARRRALASPARVLTNDDLTSEQGLSSFGTSTPPTAASVDDGDLAARRVAVTPATFQGGALPRIPVEAVSGGEVVLELIVDNGGRVADIITLRDTPPFTREMIATVRGWQFKPAEDADAVPPGQPIDRMTQRAVESGVLVVGLFRPPALFPITLGEMPKDVGSPSQGVPGPAVPLMMPLYPPQSLFDGVVLTELRVGTTGTIVDAQVVRSSPGLDGPSLDAVRRLAFRPARVHGDPTPVLVYVVTAFRQPVIK